MNTDDASSYRCLRDFFEELDDIALFQMDTQGRVTSWSPGVEAILGYSESEFVGRDVRELFTPEDRAQHADEAELERARVDGRSPDMRWHLKKGGGRIFVDGVIKGAFAADGTHIGYSKVMRDISPQRMEAGMLRAILDGTPDAIYMKDCAGRFTFANSVAVRILGRPIDEIIGYAVEDLFPPHISGPLRENDKDVAEQEKPTIVEERLLSKGDGELTFLSGKAPWYDGDRKVIGVVTIGQDISDRKRTEDERERLVEQLRRSNENLAEFAHVVAHDLQTPLRTINSYTKLLVQDYGDRLDSTADEFISYILQGAKSMNELINSLLKYAEAGEEKLTRTTVRLDAVLSGVRSNLRTLIQESSAKLNYMSLPTIVGDPVQLLQLFQNLIGNAIKYARAGVVPRIKISAQQIGSEEYRFAVEDNGMGIDEGHFERVFLPLKRLHGDEITGSGIGLAICKKIVERHGGRIWVASELGIGSTFYFTIPYG